MKQVKMFGSQAEVAEQVRRQRTLVERVREIMVQGHWWSLGGIVAMLKSRGVEASDASVSARLRDLRKPKYGGYTVERRKSVDPAARKSFVYRVTPAGGAS